MPDDGPQQHSNSEYFLGVDVGTGSVRAGLFDASGRIRSHAGHPIELWEPEPEFAEQSTGDIWRACCRAVRRVLAEAGVTADAVHGVGFDATCSLAVVDEEGGPVSVSPSGDAERNVIVWMDHRAREEAAAVNRLGHEVLRYVGGRISPEMQVPKLRWLKHHLPDTWRRRPLFFDLADYLTFRATGSQTRSVCTTVCKWTYLAHEAKDGEDASGWKEDFWRAAGLGDIAEAGFRQVGTEVRDVGTRAGRLSPVSADELGLAAGTPVAVSVIDAHAGAVGMLGTPIGEAVRPGAEMDDRLALIAGTSACHLAVSADPRFVPGIWGPYYAAVVPGLWLTEGGQSAAGALLDHLIRSHSRERELQREADRSGRNVYALLNDRLERLAEGADFPAALTAQLHVLPYFHGNRSPRADPTLRGVISGLRLVDSVDELALLYLAAVQALAYGSRHIIEEMNRAGYRIETIIVSGGLAKNPVYLREHADVTGCRVVIPAEEESMLLGSAMLGAAASGRYASVPEAMRAMSRPGTVLEPDPRAARYHDAKYAVFHEMYADFMKYRGLMA